MVTAIGEGVEGFEIGDKVSIEPAVPCGQCEDCRKGHYNLCKNIKMLAIPGERDGVNAEYCVHSANMCYKLPDNMTTLQGAMIEPLAVGMHQECLTADARASRNLPEHFREAAQIRFMNVPEIV